jgi:DNA-binding Lrp family transcriptional regulator
MDVDNTFIKPILLFYFGKGKTEEETRQELSKNYEQFVICSKTISKWFAVFRNGERSKNDKRAYNARKKVSEEHIIELINENPGLNMSQLAELAGTSQYIISNVAHKIIVNGERVNYRFKNSTKFTDEIIIDLVNSNPELNMRELGELIGASETTISHRIRQINSKGERVKYVCKRSQKIASEPSKEPKKKFTDEFIIKLVNDNPDLNMRELANVAGIPRSTLSKRIRKINNSGKKLNYTNKVTEKRQFKFSDEYLIDLINNNPDLNIAELGKLADVSKTTITNRIKQVNSNGERVKYVSKNNKGNGSEVRANPSRKYTDEFLIDLLKEEPDISIKDLASFFNTSVSAVSKRLKKINWIDIRENNDGKLSDSHINI